MTATVIDGLDVVGGYEVERMYNLYAVAVDIVRCTGATMSCKASRRGGVTLIFRRNNPTWPTSFELPAFNT